MRRLRPTPRHVLIVAGFAALAAAALPVADERVSASAPAWRALMAEFARRPDAIAEFEERRVFPFRYEPLILKGEARVSRRHGLSLHYTAPEERTVIVDESGVLVRDAAGERAPASDPRAGAAHDAMLHILRMDVAGLEKDFEVHGAIGADEWALRLVPRAETLRRAVGEIHVAGVAAAVRRIELRRSARQHIEITLGPAREVGGFTARDVQRYFR